MTMTVKTRILRIEELLKTVHGMLLDLEQESDLHLRPARAAVDQVTDAITHAIAPRETAGNLFKADKSGEQQLCIGCHRYWVMPPLRICIGCQHTGWLPPKYEPRAITPEERAMRDDEIQAITRGQHQWPFGEEK